MAYDVLLLAMIITGAGFGIFISSVTTAGTTAVDPKESSLASGLIYMSRNTGGAIGIGAVATIVSIVSASKIATEAAALGLTGLTHSQIVAVRALLVRSESAQQVLNRFGPTLSTALVSIAKDSLVSGIQAGYLFSTIVSAIAVLVAFTALQPRKRTSSQR